MTDNIDAKLAANQFLKQVYLVFGKDYKTWNCQRSVLVWTDYLATLRPDIEKYWRDNWMEFYLIENNYIDADRALFTDKWEVIC